jgi:uncharacterized paraquat-inducible protein A
MAAIILQCRKCEAEIQAPLAAGGMVRSCAACGHDRLYIQKDFNRNLGLAIVVAGSVISVILFALGYAFSAIVTLGVTALIDVLVYAMVGSVTVCYVCHTIYRGFPKNPEHGLFDLKELEKFGGRDPRF